MIKTEEKGYEDFEIVMTTLNAIVMQMVADGMETAAIMAGGSVSLIRLAQAMGIDKESLKARLTRDIELMYMGEAQRKEMLQ